MSVTSDYTKGGAIGDVPVSDAPHEFATVGDLEPIALLEGLRVRAVNGERITLAVVEMAPGLVMPEHRHANEQVGVVVRGEFTFTIGGESRVRRAGDMWVIPPGVPHTVAGAGPEGCTVAEVFSPPREDWSTMEREVPSPGRWP